MSELSNLIYNNDFIIKLRMDNEFDSDSYRAITENLKLNISEWKIKGSVPVDDVVSLMALVDFLAGGSRFWSQETSIKVEDACIELQEIIVGLTE